MEAGFPHTEAGLTLSESLSRSLGLLFLSIQNEFLEFWELTLTCEAVLRINCEIVR